MKPPKTKHLETLAVQGFRRRLNKGGKRLLGKLFSDEEKRYCEQQFNPFTHYSARYAAKKAFCRIYHLPLTHWKSITIHRSKDGQPSYKIEKQLAKKIGYVRGNVLLSLSHTDKTVAAYAVLRNKS